MLFDSSRFPASLLRKVTGRKSGVFQIDAPGGPVKITRDENGYPTIEARDRFESAWAKGWLHARDRLGQVLLTRMAASGRLMEVLGDQPMARTVDRAVRLLRMPMGLDEHVAGLNETASRLLESYCAGFEAGKAGRPFARVLGLIGVDTSELCVADVMLGYRMVCFFGLTSFQQIAEMLVGELVHDGADEEFLRLLLGPGADGIDIEAIAKMEVPADLALLGTPLGGSNAFAVSGARSASGGALLMSEAHMEIGRFPPIFYVTHEEYSDGTYQQGVSIPGVPWLAMGRTRHVGWTYTFGHADNVDVIIERCQNGRYLVGDEWRPLRRRTERVKIRGGTEELWTYWDNDYGSILADAAEGDLPCVRWSGLHESTADDTNSIVTYLNCRTVEEIADAHRGMKTISLGVVVADRAGRVGRIHTGRVDQRPDEWTGAYPRPGWDFDHGTPDCLGEQVRPWLVDPPEGYVVSANEYVEGQAGERWVNFPEPPYRWEQLRETLGDRDQTTLRDLVEASYDEFDRMALRLAPIWAPLVDDPAFERVVTWATGQSSRQSDDDRRALGLFHALHHEVVRTLLERKISSPSAERVLDRLGLLLCFQAHLDEALALEHPDLLDEDDLRELLQVAWPRARKLVASGDWHIPVRSRFKSVFTQGKLPPQLKFSTRERDFPGGPTSPFQMRVMAFEGEKVVGGPAFHYVCDMREDGGFYHIPGGASELPWGAGYGTGVDEWVTGQFFRLGDPQSEPPNL